MDECSEIHAKVGKVFTFPFMELLGIDAVDEAPHDDCNWPGAKKFLRNAIKTLRDKQKESEGLSTGVGTLEADVFGEVAETIERQMLMAPFFRDDQGGQTDLTGVPLTNLSCESFMAELDNELKHSGGAVSCRTVSRKYIIKTNQYLESKEFLGLSHAGKRKKWSYGSNSPEAKAVEKLYDDHTNLVMEVKILTAEAKQKTKANKFKSMLKTFESCKGHGGPVTKETTGILDGFNEKQLLLEISHLRNTTNCNIQQTSLVKDAEGNGTFHTFSEAQLRSNIKDAICPESTATKSVEELLSPFIEAPESHEHKGKRVKKKFNDGNLYEGTVHESFGPTANRMHRVVVRSLGFAGLVFYSLPPILLPLLGSTTMTKSKTCTTMNC